LTAILGISAFYHDSAAALIVDGTIVAAAQEERFTRKKHDPGFPSNAVAYCLHEAGLDPHQLDYVAYYEKPLLKFERLLETYIAFAPRGFNSFCKAMGVWLKDKIHLRRTIRKSLPSGTTSPILFLDHHQSHGASAFFPSPFDQAAILTMDGVGEWSTSAWGTGNGNQIEFKQHQTFPHSLGLLYSAFTYYCGFKVNSGEYKLMGLAPFGQPIYRDAILRHLVDLKEDGSLRLQMRFFNYCHALTMTNRRFDALFGAPPRSPESRIEQRHMDLAASIQSVTEEVMVRTAHHIHSQTGLKSLVLAGGVALNCVANSRILRDGPFHSIWIQPAAGDAGGALGAALFVWYQLLRNPRKPSGVDSQRGSFLGPRFRQTMIESALIQRGIRFATVTDEELFREVAARLSNGEVVGWFQGRMEYGPRALGNRSILGDPRSTRMQSVMNQKIKMRESFRPFAPAVLAEHAEEWFEVPRHQASPYMLLIGSVRPDHRLTVPADLMGMLENHPDLNERLNLPRSKLPAVTHIDHSARLQTVDEERNPRFYELIKAFDQLTGCPILVNTSFNVRGEPIVCTPGQAIDCFLATDMDVLVLENSVILKKNVSREPVDRERHLAQFAPD